MAWIVLHQPQGEPDCINSDQICRYHEADKGGTFIAFSDGYARVYRESPIEVKRLIKGATSEVS